MLDVKIKKDYYLKFRSYKYFKYMKYERPEEVGHDINIGKHKGKYTTPLIFEIKKRDDLVCGICVTFAKPCCIRIKAGYRRKISDEVW